MGQIPALIVAILYLRLTKYNIWGWRIRNNWDFWYTLRDSNSTYSVSFAAGLPSYTRLGSNWVPDLEIFVQDGEDTPKNMKLEFKQWTTV